MGWLLSFNKLALLCLVGFVPSYGLHSFGDYEITIKESIVFDSFSSQFKFNNIVKPMFLSSGIFLLASTSAFYSQAQVDPVSYAEQYCKTHISQSSSVNNFPHNHCIAHAKDKLSAMQSLHTKYLSIPRHVSIDHVAAEIVAKRFYGVEIPSEQQIQDVLETQYEFFFDEQSSSPGSPTGSAAPDDKGPISQGHATLVQLYKKDILPYLDWKNGNSPLGFGLVTIPSIPLHIRENLYTFTSSGQYPELQTEFDKKFNEFLASPEFSNIAFDTLKQQFVDEVNQLLQEDKIDVWDLENLLGLQRGHQSLYDKHPDANLISWTLYGPAKDNIHHISWHRLFEFGGHPAESADGITIPESYRGKRIEPRYLARLYQMYFDVYRQLNDDTVVNQYEFTSSLWKRALAHIPILGGIVDGVWDLADGHTNQGIFEILHGALQVADIVTGFPVAEVELAGEGLFRYSIGEHDQGREMMISAGLGALDLGTGAPIFATVQGIRGAVTNNKDLIFDAVVMGTFYQVAHLRGKMHEQANEVYTGVRTPETFYDVQAAEAIEMQTLYKPVREINTGQPQVDTDTFNTHLRKLTTPEANIEPNGEYARFDGVRHKFVRVRHQGEVYIFPAREISVAGRPKLEMNNNPGYEFFPLDIEGEFYGITRHGLKGGMNKFLDSYVEHVTAMGSQDALDYPSRVQIEDNVSLGIRDSYRRLIDRYTADSIERTVHEALHLSETFQHAISFSKQRNYDPLESILYESEYELTDAAEDTFGSLRNVTAEHVLGVNDPQNSPIYVHMQFAETPDGTPLIKVGAAPAPDTPRYEHWQLGLIHEIMHVLTDAKDPSSASENRLGPTELLARKVMAEMGKNNIPDFANYFQPEREAWIKQRDHLALVDLIERVPDRAALMKRIDKVAKQRGTAKQLIQTDQYPPAPLLQP